MNSFYLKAIRSSQKYLIQMGCFRMALIGIILNNLIIKSYLCIRFYELNKRNIPYFNFIGIELTSMLEELSPKLTKFTNNSRLETNASELINSAGIWDRHGMLNDLEAKKILIVGPGEYDESQVLNHDLVVLLNPILANLKYKEGIRVLIILNKTCTQRELKLIQDCSKNLQVTAILTKIWFPEFNGCKNIFLIDSTDLISFSPISGTPNLLPIALFAATKWSPERVQILGCDFYSGKNSYRSSAKPLEIQQALESEKSNRPFVSLSLHNPFTQLSFLKLFQIYFASRDIQLITNLGFMKYFDLANKLNQKFN